MIFTSTIAAISTPPGKGGVAVIRISGNEAIEIAEKIFKPKTNVKVCDITPRKQVYGDILYNGEQIDDGLLTYFASPNSYTGEDVIEISCHGGMLITKMVLESAFVAGAVPAQRGEFTKRAFVNGKLSLTETEAISMLLEAKSEAQVMISREKSRSKLKSSITDIRESLVSLLSSVYARIDYPEEDLGEFTDEEIIASLTDINSKLESLMKTYKTGKAINEGISTVICGKPNVGKSTLYNLLVDDDAAIVTDIPGTTRDVLERYITLSNVMLRLYDTAGIRNGNIDKVEEIGIERSREKIDGAELIFALFDASRDFDEEDKQILDCIKNQNAEKIALITKCDNENDANVNKELQKRILYIKNEISKCDFLDVIEVSAKCSKEETIDRVSNVVERLYTDEKIKIGDDAIVSSARQYSSLVRAVEFLKTAICAFKYGMPTDAASSDIELALGAIAELDGRSVTEEIVNDIFSKFCVGK